MQIDFSTITAYQRYKLMASLIVPRPIALVTTQNAQGVINAAPFSMFNMLGEDPPILMISVNKLQDTHLKHTSANILANGQFVVHIADEPMAEQMHRCGDTVPADQSELELVGLTTAPCRAVRPPGSPKRRWPSNAGCPRPWRRQADTSSSARCSGCMRART
jgi:flavin reductase (DIM6/NTAB) family NADH-FMN oxidoreductase RutF